MNENVHNDGYHFAYDEASSELLNILKSFEQLCLQKNRVEKLMEVLKPMAGLPGEVNTVKGLKKASHQPHFMVVTRLTVL
jgi:hypothetical protein